MAAEFVLDHALNNVWCTPDQDHLIIIPPVKISEPNGSYVKVRVLWEMVDLPSTTSYYHVYQIGQVPPSIYNLPIAKATWWSAGSLCETQNMVFKAYNEKGIMYPLNDVFVRINRDNNVIVALRIRNDFPAVDFSVDDLHLQMYSDAFYQSARWADMKTAAGKPNARPVQYVYRTIRSANDIAIFRNDVNIALSNTLATAATVLYYKNGRYTNDVSTPMDLQLGDVVEAIVDSSIKLIRHVPLTSMASFTSIGDAITKRLFPAIKDTTTIDYKDDVDFYLVSSASLPKYRDGLFFNQNQLQSIRQITHNAYALSNLQLQAKLSSDTIIANESAGAMVAVIRHSGWKRDLLQEHRRLLELYKLSITDINNALTGIDSTIPEWRADNLEASDYMRIVSAFAEDITTAMVENAYGYNLMTRLFCDPYPAITVNSGVKQVARPIGIDRAVLTVYDSDGHLVTTTNSAENAAIYPLPLPSTTASIVELTPGAIAADNRTNRYYGLPVVAVSKSLHTTGYRCYACPIEGGEPNEEWLDVTSSNYFSISPDGLTLTWDMEQLDILQYYPAVVVGGDVLWYKVPLSGEYPGFIRFSINANRWVSPIYPAAMTVPPVFQNGILRIQPAVMDLIMDGESLIEGIDYKVEWPQIVVFKRPLRTPDEGLSLYVRAYGFCESGSMSRVLPRETGFVKGGILSANLHRDIRNDRNIRIVIGGKLRRRTDVKFSEDGAPTVNSSLNGLPYSITDIIMPVESFTSKETMAYRALSVDVDQRVGNYMTTKDPGTPPPALNPILQKYDLYSPFCSALLHNFKDGWLNNGELDGDYDNLDMQSWLAPWEYLLAYDPCQMASLDTELVFIRPHQYATAMTLTSKQYTFMEKVIRDFLTIPLLGTRVDLSQFVVIHD